MEQLTLSFEPGISKKHRSLLDCCATGIYRTGLSRVAADIDIAPSNLSTALSGADRKFGVDHLEKYIEKYGDLEPIYYLVDRFMQASESTSKAQLIDQANNLMSELRSALSQIKD